MWKRSYEKRHEEWNSGQKSYEERTSPTLFEVIGEILSTPSSSDETSKTSSYSETSIEPTISLPKMYASDFLNKVRYNAPSSYISGWYNGIKNVNRYISDTSFDRVEGVIEIYLDDNYMNHSVEYDADQLIKEYQNDIGHVIDSLLDKYRDDYDLSEIPDEITINVCVEWIYPD